MGFQSWEQEMERVQCNTTNPGWGHRGLELVSGSMKHKAGIYPEKKGMLVHIGSESEIHTFVLKI